MSYRLKLLCAWGALLVLGFSVYAAGLSGYWVFDDFHNIVQNYALTSRVGDQAHLIALLTSSDAGIFYRPLSVLSFYLDSQWFGLSPEAFKFTNILIHLGTGLCFAGMGRSLLNLYREKHAPGWNSQHVNAIVLAATAIWLVHPINLTAVLYVVQRETSLSALFTALAVWSYVWGRQRQQRGRSSVWVLWIVTPSLTLLGMACKENAALVPVFLGVIEVALFDFRLPDGRVSRQLTAFFSIFLVLPALLAAFLILRGSPALMGGYLIRDFSLSERLLTESRVLFTYLRWIALPDLRQLGLYHDDIVVSRGLLQPWTTLPAVLGIIALLTGALALRRRLRFVSFAILWFFAGHLMESSVFPLEIAFEHRNYVPLYGLLLGTIATLGELATKSNIRRLLILMAVLVVAVFSGLTALRASEWRSPLAFAVYEAGHHPGSARSQYEVGAVYSTLALDGAPELAENAETAMLKARALDPNSISEDLSLAMTYTVLKREEKVNAYMRDAIERGGHALMNAETQASLQAIIAFLDDGKHLPSAEASQLFQAILSNPHAAGNPCFTGNLLNTYALFLQRNGDIPQAMGRMHQALSLCPSLIYTRISYTGDLITYHDIPDALEQMKIIEAVNTWGQYTLYVDRLKAMIAKTENQK